MTTTEQCKEIQRLSDRVAALHIIVDVLWKYRDKSQESDMVFSVSLGAPTQTDRLLYPDYCKAVADEGHRIAVVLDAELKRLKFISHKF